MNKRLRQDAEEIVRYAIEQVKPDTAVKRALKDMRFPGRIILVAVGKAAWQMAAAALEASIPIDAGIVITKYGHVMGPLPGIDCFEAGHPVPDENSFRATQAVLDLTANLKETDTVLFLLSGGGSALFEKPLICGEELQDITNQLLARGANIVEINTIRKRLSAVKGGKFAEHCSPARVKAIILSDILGDPLDMIASGPTVEDQSTCHQAVEISKKYQLTLSNNARICLQKETPKELHNSDAIVIGSVRELCRAAEEKCNEMGYRTVFLTDQLSCEALEAGAFLASILKSHADTNKKIAFLAGGETVVHIQGSGKGGRNQELALSSAPILAGIPQTCVISVGSDGTDGPTDAAGGYADGDTLEELLSQNINCYSVLQDNDSYHALKKIDGLIITGPTGTNVNDLTIGLIG